MNTAGDRLWRPSALSHPQQGDTSPHTAAYDVRDIAAEKNQHMLQERQSKTHRAPLWPPPMLGMHPERVRMQRTLRACSPMPPMHERPPDTQARHHGPKGVNTKARRLA